MTIELDIKENNVSVSLYSKDIYSLLTNDERKKFDRIIRQALKEANLNFSKFLDDEIDEYTINRMNYYVITKIEYIGIKHCGDHHYIQNKLKEELFGKKQ